MRIDHVALWTADLEASARFWSEHFGAQVGSRYESTGRLGFASRFVTLPGGGATVELMTGPWVRSIPESDDERQGWAHVAVSVGSVDRVRELAARFMAAGLLVSPPRTTGDGFYEAIARAPDGTLVDITS